MSIAVAPEHEELRRTLRRWVEARCPREVVRATLDSEAEELPPFWEELGAQGWLGIHVPEDCSGQGFGFMELAIVLEEFARALAPGPVFTSMLVASVAGRASDPGKRKGLLARIVDASAPATVALPGSGVLHGTRADDGSLVVSGTLRPVMCAATARLLLVPVVAGSVSAASPFAASDDADENGATATSGHLWCVIEASDATSGASRSSENDSAPLSMRPLHSLDPLRRSSEVKVQGLRVPSDGQLEGVRTEDVRNLALALASFECAGGSRWCLEATTAHAIDRRQFGRPIGQFQAVKHRLAEMLVKVEQVSALGWDVAQANDSGDPDQASLADVLAAALSLDAYTDCAKSAIQLHGGMGFTWEHDAHLHLRRALSMRQLLGGTNELRVEASKAALAGRRRTLSMELPEEAEHLRAEIAPLVRKAAAVHGAERRAVLVESGLVAPHWPAPWGRGAGPVEQIVIEQELAAAGVHRPNLAVGAWALPTIIAHGTVDQQQRFVGPTMAGELVWCQLFSEPGAGSDLASLSTRAMRTEGGWVLDGQKVWTSVARKADWGICLARSDPEAPKHEGITYFLVDMHSEGIEIRPLREITGEAMFNEVFLTEVFVPDECVVGPPGGGWRLARTTLANERVSMSSGATFGFGIESILAGMASHPGDEDRAVLEELGGLIAEAHSVAVLGARSTLRSVSGVDPGSEASVRKLLGAEHEQRVQEMGLVLLGPEGASYEDDAARWGFGFLSTRCLTIAGGTSEVQRNVIGERILGLPRDPEPGH